MKIHEGYYKLKFFMITIPPQDMYPYPEAHYDTDRMSRCSFPVIGIPLVNRRSPVTIETIALLPESILVKS